MNVFQSAPVTQPVPKPAVTLILIVSPIAMIPPIHPLKHKVYIKIHII
jgi:hypothetical protein